MAKPFYSMEEVCEKLGQSADHVRELVREGTLREFRDAGKVFFKAEDVDRLARTSAPTKEDSGEVVLEPAEEGAELPTLVDSSGGTSVIGLEPLEEEKPKPEEDTVITASGIGVFDDDELEIDADPMAKTQITAGAAVDDQVALESAGSGSGLLDLSREADDTSLGAELLDEIYPGEEEAAEEEPAAAGVEPASKTVEREEPELAYVPADTGEALVAPVLVGDPAEGLFSGLLVGALILLALAGSIVPAVFLSYLPDYAVFLSDNFYFFLGGAALVVILSLVIGWLLGRTMTGRRWT